MKILSWNVNLGSPISGGDIISRGVTALNTIKRINPEILVLQESSELFNNHLKTIGYTVFENIRAHCGLLTVLTKSEHVKWCKHISSETAMCGTYIICKYKDIRIVACHLSSGEQYNEGRDVFVKQNDLSDTILIGDLNTPNSQQFSTHFLKDIAIENNKHCDTWSHSFFKSRSTRKARYDRVLSSVVCETFTSHVECYGQSDHIPISIDIL